MLRGTWEVGRTVRAGRHSLTHSLFATFQELGGSLDRMETGHFLDTFFALARSSDEGPLAHSQNVMKALRWYKKLLGLQPFPDLYSAAFTSFTIPSYKDKRESLPLPLAFCAYLERELLSENTPPEKALWCGSVLACISASLRFADAQHVKWTTLCVSQYSLRGICFRTKTSKRGAPFAFVSFGPIGWGAGSSFLMMCGMICAPALGRKSRQIVYSSATRLASLLPLRMHRLCRDCDSFWSSAACLPQSPVHTRSTA